MDNYNRVIYTTPYDSEVEYLEIGNTSNCYIDTGILPSNDISIVTQTQVLDNYGGFLFDGGNSAANSELGFLLKGNIGEASFRYGKYNIPKQFTFPSEPFIISSLDNPRTLVVNGTNFSAASNTFSSQNSICLFGQHRNNGISGTTKNCRVYYFKMYNSGILVRDFIPVRVGSVGYMYDKVSGKLFANSGTGNFILGADVPNPVPNIRSVFRFGNKRFVMPMPFIFYEYLKGILQINATSVMALNINSNNFNYVTKLKVIGNNGLLSIQGMNYYCLNDTKIKNWDSINNKNIKEYANNSNVIEVNCENGHLVMNDINIDTYNKDLSEYSIFSFYNASNRYTSQQFISKVYIDNKLRYIPCKLADNIPSSMDFNNIARTAGECGMYDVKLEKFIGNRNTAKAQFTVTNDIND